MAERGILTGGKQDWYLYWKLSFYFFPTSIRLCCCHCYIFSPYSLWSSRDTLSYGRYAYAFLVIRSLQMFNSLIITHTFHIPIITLPFNSNCLSFSTFGHCRLSPSYTKLHIRTWNHNNHFYLATLLACPRNVPIFRAWKKQEELEIRMKNTLALE